MTNYQENDYALMINYFSIIDFLISNFRTRINFNWRDCV